MISERASSPERSHGHPGQLAHRLMLIYDEYLGYVPLR